MPYLVEQWNEGCRNGKRLYREIRERGYQNSEETCARFVAQLRRAEAKGKPPSSVPRARRGSIAGLSPTSKNVAALFVRRREKLSEEQKAYLGRLCASDEALADAHRLTRDFAKMVRDLEGGKLDGWLEEAGTCAAPAMRNFAAGLKNDLAAVRAGACGGVVQRTGGGVRAQAQAAQTAGLREGGFRPAQGEDATNGAELHFRALLGGVCATRLELRRA